MTAEHIAWALMGLSALVYAWAHNQGGCFHKFTTGGGLCGDAWSCTKCSLDKYPEHIGFKPVYKILGRVKELN